MRSTSPAPGQNINKSAPAQYINKTSPAPAQFINKLAPAPGQYMRSTAPAPGQFINKSAPIPEHFINNSAPVPAQFINSLAPRSGPAPAPAPYSNLSSQTYDIPGLVLWLDASDSSTISHNYCEFTGNQNIEQSYVCRWKDKSKSGYIATKLEKNYRGATYPIYNKTNIPSVAISRYNGFVVRIPANTFSNAFIIFVVSQRVGTGNNDETLITRTVNNIPAPFDMYNTTRLFGNKDKYTSVESPYNVKTNMNLNINTFCIIDSTYTEYLNNNLLMTQDVSNMNLRDDSSLLGIGTRADNKTGYNGNISEILVYNSQLTSIQISTINNYLMQKWNIKK
jgi:hypothetical protein